MIVKVPVYVEFDSQLTPDGVEEFGVKLRAEFLRILKQGYSGKDFEKYISVGKQKITFKLLTRSQVEDRILSNSK